MGTDHYRPKVVNSLIKKYTNIFELSGLLSREGVGQQFHPMFIEYLPGSVFQWVPFYR